MKFRVFFLVAVVVLCVLLAILAYRLLGPGKVLPTPSVGPGLCTQPRDEWCRREDLTPMPAGEPEYGYEQVPPDLCPPDTGATKPPIFVERIGEEERSGFTVYSRVGFLVNEHGEIFQIKVSGRDREAVQAYTEAVRVCFDLILTGSSPDSMPDAAPASDELLPDVLAGDPHNLIIEVNLLAATWGAVAVEVESAGTPIASPTLAPVVAGLEGAMRSVADEYPPEQWVEEMRKQGEPLVHPQDWIREHAQDAVVDFIVDPSIGNGGFHNYPSQCKKSATVTLDVAGGSGSVTGYLYRNGNLKQIWSVDRDGDAMETRCHNGAPHYATYDLGVHGNENGSKYRVSGRWAYGWNAAAPGGGGTACTP